MYPRCGKLYPEGLAGLAKADDYEQVKQVCDFYSDYKQLFENSGLNPGEKTLEDKFFEHEVILRSQKNYRNEILADDFPITFIL